MAHALDSTQLRFPVKILVPVGKLPPELLSRIFVLFMQLLGDHAGHGLQNADTHLAPTAPLLGITHVCYWWRAVALQTPALWKQVDNRYPAPLKAALVSRSQSMPLSVIVDAKRLDIVLEQHGLRLGRLHVIISDSVTSPARSLTSVRDLPMLEYLAINSDCDVANGHSDTTLVFFGTPVSPLKALALRPVPAWCPGNQFPNLTHLYLDWSNCAPWERNGDSIRYLASLLARTPALQYLHLVHMDEDEGARTARISSPPSAITLSSMRAVTCLHSNMATAIYLLSFLELPDTALVRLDELERIHWREAYHSPPAASPRLVSSCSRAQLVFDFDHLFLHAESPQSGALRIRGGIIFAFDENDPNWCPFVSWLNHLGILPSIRTLHLRAMDDVAAISLLLRCTRSLESLTVVLQTGDWLHIRVHARAIYAALGDPAQCCRQLRSLVVLVRSSDPEDMCHTELLSMLEARTRSTRPLEYLAVKQWWTPKQDPQAVRDEHQRWDKGFKSLIPLAKAHVQTVEFARGEGVHPFKMRDVWRIDGAEDYWELPPGHRRV